MRRTYSIQFTTLQRTVLSWLLLVTATFSAAGCELIETAGEPDGVENHLSVPSGFPSVPWPAHNPITRAKVDLGQRLFTDAGLSSDGTVSCQSCHLPEAGFAEHVPVSIGVDGRSGIRNSPSLVNVAYQNLFFWDGGALSLENQVFGPLESEDEMNANLGDVLDYLTADSSYVQAFERAFRRPPDLAGLTQALASFQRTIRSGGSRYDTYLSGQTGALSESERRGLNLFEGKANCTTCHSGFLISDRSFRNNGLAVISSDSGRARITTLAEDYGRFKVPSLRNVDITAPYMHDGRFQSLMEVVDHYDAGGSETRQQDAAIQPLHLTAQEKADLAAFLRSLSDTSIRVGLSGN